MMKFVYVCIGMLMLSDVAMGVTVRNTGRPATARDTRRATVSGRAAMSVEKKRQSGGTVSRAVVARSGTAQGVALMTKTSDMLNTCKAQYMQCMDNFCNVLDDNQGRCSCSKNLKNYAATEAALEKATEELQDVAQKIQYIGLSSDEITTLFTQTEAELTMQSKSDSTQLKNDLDRIKNLIVDVKSGTASVSSDSGLSLDLSGLLDFTISNTGFDLSSMFGGSTANTSSISNQRGEQLYKTATSRCKAAVLNTCAAQGVDISLITNSYDLEIDKQCIAYERSLTETNTQMASTVRNAKSVLQKARLMVAQQKNQYDLRGCVNALDSCMQDDFVCGSDYENCLDPTGKWIVNGEVVVGGNIGNANISDTDIANMLRTKIGNIDSRGRANGMCASVMQKCQNHTMQNGKYDNNNALLTEYISRTTNIIKKRRQIIISEYATKCLGDVVSCLNTNNRNGGSFSDVAINACSAVITTCKSVTDGASDNNIKQWLHDFVGVDYDPIQHIPDAVLGINDYRDVTAQELERMRQEDITACQKIPGAKLSESGALCIIHGANESISSDAVLAMAKKAVAAYGGVVVFGVDNNRGYSETFAKFPYYNARMYMMRFAYYQAKIECENRGGKLNISLGGRHEAPLCGNVPVENEEECIAFRSDAPAPYSYGLQSIYDASTGMCRYLARGMYFYSREIPGKCSSGATENALGDCEF